MFVKATVVYVGKFAGQCYVKPVKTKITVTNTYPVSTAKKELLNGIEFRWVTLCICEVSK